MRIGPRTQWDFGEADDMTFGRGTNRRRAARNLKIIIKLTKSWSTVYYHYVLTILNRVSDKTHLAAGEMLLPHHPMLERGWPHASSLTDCSVVKSPPLAKPQSAGL